MHDHIHPQKRQYICRTPTLTIRRPAPNTRKTMLLTDHRPHEEQTPESKHRKQTSALPDKKTPEPLERDSDVCFSTSQESSAAARDRKTDAALGRYRLRPAIAASFRRNLQCGSSPRTARQSDLRHALLRFPALRHAQREPPDTQIGPVSGRQRASTSRTAPPTGGG